MSGAGAAGAAGRWLLVAAAVVVVAAVATALLLIDPPAQERAERLDGKRVEDLQVLASRIDSHVDVHDALPRTLAVVADGPGPAIVDPADGLPYEYVATGKRSYRLCARFATTSGEVDVHGPDAWRHDTGRQCFDLESPLHDSAAAAVSVAPER